MSKFLLLTNESMLIKITVNLDPNAIVHNMDSISHPDVNDEYDTPVGKCKCYAFNRTWIYATDRYIVEVSPDDIIADVKCRYDVDSEEFKHFAHILVYIILGYIIGRSEVIYRNKVMTYLTSILFEEDDDSINIDMYNRFIKVETEMGITKHISAQDIIFEKYTMRYSKHDRLNDISVIDISGTDCDILRRGIKAFYI